MKTIDPEELKAAELNYERALTQLRKCIPGQIGMGDDKRYGAAYQALVRMGARPQLKRCYRHG